MDFHLGILKILTPTGSLAGTGFLVSASGLIATCSHVVLPPKEQVNHHPLPEAMRVVFYAGGEERIARVLPEYFRGIPQEIAFLQLEGNLPPGAQPLPLGRCPVSGVLEFRSFGYPSVHGEGLGAIGKIIDRTTLDGIEVLQLESDQLSHGHSGSPIWVAGHVVGVHFYHLPTDYGPDSPNRLAIPSESLVAVCPTLPLVELPPPGNTQAMVQKSNLTLHLGLENSLSIVSLYFSDYLSAFIHTLWKPSAHFQSTTTGPQQVTSIGKSPHPTQGSLQLDPKLISFGIFSICIGSIFQSLTPGRGKLLELPVLIVAVTVLWIMISAIFFAVFRLFGGRGGFLSTLSISFQLMAVIYVIASLCALIATLVGSIFIDDYEYHDFFYTGIQLILYFIYLPLVLKNIHFGSSTKDKIFLASATLLSIFIFFLLATAFGIIGLTLYS